MSSSSSTSAAPPCTTHCDPIGSDWWPYKSEDIAPVSHTPSGSVIRDFTAQHITPFGGWFTFTSPDTPEYYHDYYICWSTSAGELDTSGGLTAARNANRCRHSEALLLGLDSIEELQGHVAGPLILIDLEPDTTYYVRAVSAGNASRTTNVVRIRTKPDPRITLNAIHPRVTLTANALNALRDRYQANESRVVYWTNMMRPRAERAMNPSDNLYARGRYAMGAALLARITGEQSHIDGARWLLLTHLIGEYERTRGEFTHQSTTGNAYRWMGADMAQVTDLLWDHLSTAERQRILDVMIQIDELPANQNVRFIDTDLHVSTTQIHISHGLTFLGSTDLNATSLNRMDTIFDNAIRRWYGIFQVKMRSVGRFGLAGGAMDDGTDYGRGTQTYWMETLWMLENAGMSQADYAPWIWNHARSNNIYTMVPGDSGMVTIGDIEAGEILSNITQPEDESWSADALKLCLMERYGMTAELAYLRDSLLTTRSPSSSTYGHHWAFACDKASFGRLSRTSLPTAFHSNGLGLVFDRTSWNANASYLFFSAGWRGVDHTHFDIGHFSLWSDGKWVTHEAPQYYQNVVDWIGTAAHSIFEYGNDSGSATIGQNAWFGAGLSRVVKTDVSSSHLFLLADTTSAYGSSRFRPNVPSKVTRSLYWDKTNNRIVVYDRVEGAKANVQREQYICGVPARGAANCNGSPTPQVTRLYDEYANGVVEMLMVVNGTGTLTRTDQSIGIDNTILFNRMTGDLQ